MKLSVVYLSDLHLIKSVTDADITTENIKTTVRESVSLGKKRECRYILFDIRLCKLNRSYMDAFNDMMNFGTNMSVPLDVVCAVLYDPETYPEERAEFIEKITAEINNPPFKMFKCEKAALEWIKKMQVRHAHSSDLTSTKR